jgi:cytochrome c oxidase subunit 2
MNQEWLARGTVAVMLAAVVIVTVAGVWDMDGQQYPSTVQLHAALPEYGGWSTDILYAKVGEPLHLQMVSDDVVHGFGVGRKEWADIELYPGIPTFTTLSFDQPGTYTFYCTRWCGPNHWRMRGTIEVAGAGKLTAPGAPRYVRLNLDIDAPHPAYNLPTESPQSRQGELWASKLPAYALALDTYWSHSPSQMWARLRAENGFTSLSDSDVWDSVAWIWAQQKPLDALALAKETYNKECAACHGEVGKGDGVMVRDLMPFSYTHGDFGHSLMQPPDFSDPEHILGASPALIEGKLLRGGMGTGMPLYGPIYTQEELEALVNYLYTFVLP